MEEKIIGFTPYITAKGKEEFMAYSGPMGYAWTTEPDLALHLSEKAAELEASEYGKDAKVCVIFDRGSHLEVRFLP